MNRHEIITLISQLSRQKLSFQYAFEQLENALSILTSADVSELLLDCGIIPEQFGHDTTEEKLWAKYWARISQIYTQAQNKNVTLLGYIHLKLMIDYLPSLSLMPLWQAPNELSPSEDAKLYWQKINAIILHISGKTETDLQAAFWEDRKCALCRIRYSLWD